MTTYLHVSVRPEEHKRLTALTFHLAGKIDSYTTKPSYSDVIRFLIDNFEENEKDELPRHRTD
jgi:Arc/MetJ-type ribon-helix-helix transcriptional regulator